MPQDGVKTENSWQRFLNAYKRDEEVTDEIIAAILQTSANTVWRWSKKGEKPPKHWELLMRRLDANRGLVQQIRQIMRRVISE